MNLYDYMRKYIAIGRANGMCIEQITDLHEQMTRLWADYMYSAVLLPKEHAFQVCKIYKWTFHQHAMETSRFRSAWLKPMQEMFDGCEIQPIIPLPLAVVFDLNEIVEIDLADNEPI